MILVIPSCKDGPKQQKSQELTRKSQHETGDSQLVSFIWLVVVVLFFRAVVVFFLNFFFFKQLVDFTQECQVVSHLQSHVDSALADFCLGIWFFPNQSLQNNESPDICYLKSILMHSHDNTLVQIQVVVIIVSVLLPVNSLALTNSACPALGSSSADRW